MAVFIEKGFGFVCVGRVKTIGDKYYIGDIYDVWLYLLNGKFELGK